MKCFRLIQFNVLPRILIPGKDTPRWQRGKGANAIARQVARWHFSLISRPPVHVSALWRGELLKHYFGKEIEIANATHTHSEETSWERTKKLAKIFAHKLISFYCTVLSPSHVFHLLFDFHFRYGYGNPLTQIEQLKQWSAFVHYSYVPLAAHFSIINCKRLSKYWYDQKLDNRNSHSHCVCGNLRQQYLH